MFTSFELRDSVLITFTYLIVGEVNWVHFEHTVWFNFEILIFCCSACHHKYGNNLETTLIPHPALTVRTANHFVRNQPTEKNGSFHCKKSFVFFENYSNEDNFSSVFCYRRTSTFQNLAAIFVCQ